MLKRIFTKIKVIAHKKVENILKRTSPTYIAKRKYASHLNFWKGELEKLQRWYEDGTVDYWGVPPPTVKKCTFSDIWVVNAVMTRHHMEPAYLEQLKLEEDCFRGKRVLEVGCGPHAPILQFVDCKRYGLDPLIDQYIQAGWPLYEYDVKFVTAKGESMPFLDAYFDAVISVNALDHVDNFRKVASEIQRVLKIGGMVYFEIEYHTPRVNEPQMLNDNVILESFSSCKMSKIVERGKKEMALSVAKRFNLIASTFDGWSNEDKCIIWHGERIK